MEFVLQERRIVKSVPPIAESVHLDAGMGFVEVERIVVVVLMIAVIAPVFAGIEFVNQRKAAKTVLRIVEIVPLGVEMVSALPMRIAGTVLRIVVSVLDIAVMENVFRMKMKIVRTVLRIVESVPLGAVMGFAILRRIAIFALRIAEHAPLIVAIPTVTMTNPVFPARRIAGNAHPAAGIRDATHLGVKIVPIVQWIVLAGRVPVRT